jgi:colanic acid/amylovoran biosynthesis glycosyltransferase
MRIAFFLQTFPKVSETFILNQITGLIDRGHSVDIYAFKENQLLVKHSEINQYMLLDRARFFENIPAAPLPFTIFAARMMMRHFPWLPLRVFSALYKFIKSGVRALPLGTLRHLFLLPKQNQYDIIHCQFGTTGPNVLALMQIGAIYGKLVTSFRGYDATIVMDNNPGVYDRLFKKGDMFLPVSESLKKKIVDAGCDPKRIFIHYSGIDCNRFAFAGESRRKDGPTKILTIGRLVEKKGIAYAIQAVFNLKRLGYRVVYTVAGDGDLKPDLENLVSSLDLKNEINLIGWKNHVEVLDLLNQSDILLTPSVSVNGDQEGIPNALKEAMAIGLPVIGTRHGGISELVEDGVSGFLVPEKDAQSLSERLIFLIENPQIGKKMGQRGSITVRQNFDIEKLNDLLVERYVSLLKGECFSENPDSKIAVNSQKS